MTQRKQSDMLLVVLLLCIVALILFSVVSGLWFLPEKILGLPRLVISIAAIFLSLPLLCIWAYFNCFVPWAEKSDRAEGL